MMLFLSQCHLGPSDQAFWLEGRLKVPSKPLHSFTWFTGALSAVGQGAPAVLLGAEQGPALGTRPVPQCSH